MANAHHIAGRLHAIDIHTPRCAAAGRKTVQVEDCTARAGGRQVRHGSGTCQKANAALCIYVTPNGTE